MHVVNKKIQHAIQHSENKVRIKITQDSNITMKFYMTTKLAKHISSLKVNNNEAMILSILLKNKGRIVARATLIEQCWPNSIVSNNSLNVAIFNIRKQMEIQELSDWDIVCAPGKGYLLIMKGEMLIN